MSEQSAEQRTGQCLCGAVSFKVALKDRHVHACHCSMCRRQTTSPFMALEASGTLEIEGRENLTIYQAREWAERFFCKGCGSVLFWRLIDGSAVMASVGALDDQSGLDFSSEVFIEEKPDFYAFAGERKRLTGQERLAEFSAQAAGGSGDGRV